MPANGSSKAPTPTGISAFGRVQIAPSCLSKNPYNDRRENKSKCSLFSVSDVFAIAKVMLFASLITMLLAKTRSDVMFAHCAEGTTSFTQ